MKYLNFAFVILILANIFLYVVNSEVPKAPENNSTLKEYLETLKNVKVFEREELKDVFRQIFYRVATPEQIANKTNLEETDKFADAVFDKLANKEKNLLILEEAVKFFDHNLIKEYITEFFKSLKMEEVIHTILNSIVSMITKMLLRFFGDEDL